MTLTVRPATADDIRHFYPEQTCSFRAMVAELDGERAGIVGLALTRPTAAMFSKFDEPLRPYLKRPAILRAIKRVEGMAKASRVPVVAIAEPTEPTAPALLERMGAKFVGQQDGSDFYGWGV